MPPHLFTLRTPKPNPIKTDLKTIHGSIIAHELFLIFEERANRDRKKYDEIRVKEVVFDIRGKIMALDKIDLKNDRHLDSYSKAREYLKEGLSELRELEKPSPKKVKRNEEKEARAIRGDNLIFEKNVRDAREARSRRKAQTQLVQFIEINSCADSSTKQLHSEDLATDITYHDLVYRLVVVKRMGAPELWVKQGNKHTITDSGTQWKYSEGRVPVETNEIFVVTADKADYMIILVHEGTQEYPIVFDLMKFGPEGRFPCCNGDTCKDLGKHLDRLWPKLEVEMARRFSRPRDTNPDILNSDFHNFIFTHRTNDLYIKCRRR